MKGAGTSLFAIFIIIFPIFHRGHARDGFKFSAEIIEVGKPNAQGDFFDRGFLFFKEHFGVLYARFIEVFHDGFLCVFLEEMGKIGSAHVKVRGELGYGYIFRIILLDVVNGVVEGIQTLKLLFIMFFV